MGPLAGYADGYRELLAGLGYTPDGVVRKVWELGRLSDWMVANGLGPDDLTAGRFGGFPAFCSGGVGRPVWRRPAWPVGG